MTLLNASAENIFMRFWQQRLFKYAETRLPMVASLTEMEKQIIFKEDISKSIAVLLHEFAAPTAVLHREFDTSHAISKSLMRSAGFKFVLHKFLKNPVFLNEQTHLRKMIQYRYVMTPRKTAGANNMLMQTGFAFKEHIRLAFKPNIAQLFLGSYVLDIVQQTDSTAIVDLYNETSRNSLFLHVPSNVNKPDIFGTISQHFHLPIDLRQYK